MLDTDHVLITTHDGKIEDIVNKNEAGEDIQQLTGILTPGFVNCHCHLELSHMKGLVPEQTGLVDFVFKVVNERHFPDEEILAAIAGAEDEMLVNGIVAVGDICNNAKTVPQKKLQRLAYYNFIEVSGWLPNNAEMRFERSMLFYEAFTESNRQTPNSKLLTSLSPHAPYSVSDELWQLMLPYFDNNTVTIHNQETKFEDELFEKGTGDFTRMYELMKMDTGLFKPPGKSSLQSYFHKLDRARQVLLVHNTFTTEADIAFVTHESSAVNWCICINANLYIEQAVPPVEMLRSNNCQMVIGTDSLASNRSLSILAEIKTISTHFPHIPLAELLQWATSNGARALQMNDELGSFEKGKKPGVLILEDVDNNQLIETSSARRLL